MPENLQGPNEAGLDESLITSLFGAEVVTRALVRDVELPGGVGTMALITLDNGHDHTRPSTFGPAGLISLRDALDAVAGRTTPEAGEQRIVAVGVTGKPFIFAVGADLTGAALIRSRDEALAIARLGHSVFRRFGELTVPSFAFVNGAALGGGLELALHCTYRTISSGVPAVAFPECFLGLLPGWGGTYLLPQLIGPAKALKVIVENPLSQNRMLRGPDAFSLGIADAIFEPADFLAESLRWAAVTLRGEDPPQTPPHGGAGRGAVAAGPVLAAAVTIGLVLAGGLLPVDPAGGAPTAQVAAIQGDVPRARNLSQQLNDSEVTQNHAAATSELATQVKAGREPAPDLVIWPEHATGLDPYDYPSIYADLAGAVAAIDRPILVGEVLQNPELNVGQLWVPGRGPTTLYAKRQLVPFGEYIPFRGLISKFSSLPSLQPVNFIPGRKAVVFDVGKIKLGDVICYEVGFDDLVRSEVNAGANLLAVQSNDADFEIDGQLGETEQQTAMARIRAIESDRAVVYASTTGESSIIAPDGGLIADSGVWRQAILDARVALVSYRTLADRVGAWPEYVIIALTVLALAWAMLLPRRKRTGTPNARTLNGAGTPNGTRPLKDTGTPGLEGAGTPGLEGAGTPGFEGIGTPGFEGIGTPGFEGAGTEPPQGAPEPI
ncbi:MAG TPA: apolipoprotein N-acyltransferase [Streptosporangiaceae bacterium]|nr:apolipoprotein N-acyltransferase [Streptosporangiaceae bacterium]